MKVLIVGKTRKGLKACIGGVVLEGFRAIRLLQADGHDYSQNCDFRIGDIWELTLSPRPNTTPPHVEDMLVLRAQRSERGQDVKSLLARNVDVWSGGPERLYNGMIRFTGRGSGYISRDTGIPPGSTGFWRPDRPLVRVEDDGSVRFQYRRGWRTRLIKYVGLDQSVGVIPGHTLVRVSLAGWWAPPQAEGLEERCYLQLSGWFV